MVQDALAFQAIQTFMRWKQLHPKGGASLDHDHDGDDGPQNDKVVPPLVLSLPLVLLSPLNLRVALHQAGRSIPKNLAYGYPPMVSESCAPLAGQRPGLMPSRDMSGSTRNAHMHSVGPQQGESPRGCPSTSSGKKLRMAHPLPQMLCTGTLQALCWDNLKHTPAAHSCSAVIASSSKTFLQRGRAQNFPASFAPQIPIVFVINVVCVISSPLAV